MFRDAPELKPISMIITTLAALAYEGEEDLDDALRGILQRMPTYVKATRPRIPNPVNPGEDFADKWTNNPVLEQNFWLWHQRALRDGEEMISITDTADLRKLSERRFGVTFPANDERSPLGGYAPIAVAAPRIAVSRPPRPWSA
jgi:hypothetical protein